MGTKKITQLTQDSSPALTDIIPTVEAPSTTPVTKYVTFAAVKTLLNVDTYRICGCVRDPQVVYDQRPQIEIFRAPAAITITRIHIHGNDTTPGAELAGDLKFADDLATGGFASATVIDVCDTTNGVFTATSSFDDATVPSGKYIYFQMDASPHADWKSFYFEIYYTFD